MCYLSSSRPFCFWFVLNSGRGFSSPFVVHMDPLHFMMTKYIVVLSYGTALHLGCTADAPHLLLVHMVKVGKEAIVAIICIYDTGILITLPIVLDWRSVCMHGRAYVLPIAY